MATPETITTDIISFIEEKGGRTLDWYVGITSNPEQRLFAEHGLQKTGEDWIYRTADTAEEARRIGKYFVVAVKTDGAGFNEANARTVYAYKKKEHTKP